MNLVIVEALKIVVVAAVFFVWVVRYENIRREFKDYNLPNWFRDLVGILKISFALMLHSNNSDVIIIGSLGITILMLGAVGVHIKMKNTFRNYIASVSMISICSFILYSIIQSQ